jgi:ATP-dependent DNA ligase
MLPVRPPVAPMLARLAPDLPVGEQWRYEPKWDGFRCLAFCAGDAVVLQSRNERPLGRYFPELTEALSHLGSGPLVLDGEILARRDGRWDFDALLRRIHPAASLVRRLAADTPASFVAFDVLAAGRDLRGEPFGRRRAHLEAVLADGRDPVRLTTTTADPAAAAVWLDAGPGSGIDGVVAKDVRAAYEPGRRTMVKVKRVRTADAVVAGLRVQVDAPAVASLLLGLYDEDGTLRHVGVAASFPARRRRELLDELAPYVVPLADHPWVGGFALEGGAAGRLAGSAGRWAPDMELDWVPLRPNRVCEVTYTHVDGRRWRHPVRFVRWRPDRDPRSCTFDQFPAAGGGQP